MVDVGALTVAESARLIRDRALSPVELIDGYLDRIDRYDGKVRSFVTVCHETARTQARRAEQEIVNGGWRGPMHGLPYTLKDVIHAKGVPTTAQSRLLSGSIPEEDSHVQTRLAAAGGVLLGKAATWEFTLGGPSWDVLQPPARNPWNLDYDTAGSSSGSCASVAAGFCSASIGTDTGGSIRTPSAWCGVAGLKPTYGLVGRSGVLPNSFTQDHVGPIAWTVEDIAILLEAIAGRDVQDGGSRQVQIPQYREQLARATLEGKIVGIPARWFEQTGVASEVMATFNNAIKTLCALGATTREVDLPPLHEYEDAKRIIALCDLFSIHADTLRHKPDVLGSSLRYRIIAGGLVRAEDYIGALRMRTALARKMQQAFATIDILALPTSGIPVRLEPQPHEDLFTGRSFNSAFNISGNPALAVCMGFAGNGLPLSLQLVGRLFDETTVLQAGYLYEKATPWRDRRPDLLAILNWRGEERSGSH